MSIKARKLHSELGNPLTGCYYTISISGPVIPTVGTILDSPITAASGMVHIPSTRVASATFPTSITRTMTVSCTPTPIVLPADESFSQRWSCQIYENDEFSTYKRLIALKNSANLLTTDGIGRGLPSLIVAITMCNAQGKPLRTVMLEGVFIESINPIALRADNTTSVVTHTVTFRYTKLVEI